MTDAPPPAAEPRAPSAERLLLVEDETDLARFVADALGEAGYAVDVCHGLKEALRAVGRVSPALVLLELGLPDGDGVDLVAHLRGFSESPVIVLSARSDEAQKIRALDAGADDYLTKPFGMAELLARVRAQLRRSARRQGESAPARLGNVTVDLAARLVTKAGEPVHLTKLEFALLARLVESRGKVLTQRQLLESVWGPAYVLRPHYLRIYMQRLRAKLEDDPALPQWLLTETGIGYRLA